MENTLTKIDRRKIGEKGLYALRIDTVALLQEGKSVQEIATSLKVSTTYVYNIKDIFEKEGVEGLQLGQRGRRKGEKRRLSPEQEQKIRCIILEETPEQQNFQEALWTRNNIHALIKQEYGIDLPLSTLSDYLSRWELSAQRPVRRALKQNEEEIERWLNEEYPKICQRAQKEGAVILFGDETNIQNTTAYMRGYAPKGQPPVAKVSGNNLKINMLSAISRRGMLRFMLYKDSMNAKKLLDFLRRLVKEMLKRAEISGGENEGDVKKVFLILDNLKVHHAKMVTDWVEKNKERIELFYLPAYAPEHNPDELLNSDLKRKAGARTSPRSQNELEHNVRSRLSFLQRTSEAVISFFRAPLTLYAS